jgi:general secretion pathway protein A
MASVAAGVAPDTAVPAPFEAGEASPAMAQVAANAALPATETDGDEPPEPAGPAPDETTAAADTPPVEAAQAAQDAEAPTPRIAMARIVAAPELPTLGADELSRALLDEDSVVDELLRLWQIDTAPGVRHLDCAAVPAFALACERSAGRWSDLRQFDRPAALKLVLSNDKSAFVVVGGLDEEHALLHRDGVVMRVPIAVLDERWSGDYLLLWRTPPVGGRVIGRADSADAIAWLRARLALLPESHLTVDPARYDANVVAAVRSFQREQGLNQDGVAGPRTLILLSNVLADLDAPRLSHSAASPQHSQ